ncbi:MAG: hypothetical protein ACOY30_14765 [Bacillota bacterium]
MKSRDLLYDLLWDKINGQEFYNSMLVRMVNPVAMNIFKSLRDQVEGEMLEIRRQFLSQEAKPQILRAVIRSRQTPG